jgi:5-methylcytosine-specific restriction endonuclease McrA
VCGVVLSEAKYHNFDHIIPKGRRPDLRLEPSNIRLVCLACHTSKHTGGRVTSYIGT